MNYKEIISLISNKDFHPIYFLMGEEPFYIDKISDYIAENVLESQEKEFNQSVLYGKDLEVAQIISEANNFLLDQKKEL